MGGNNGEYDDGNQGWGFNPGNNNENYENEGEFGAVEDNGGWGFNPGSNGEYNPGSASMSSVGSSRPNINNNNSGSGYSSGNSRPSSGSSRPSSGSSRPNYTNNGNYGQSSQGQRSRPNYY